MNPRREGRLGLCLPFSKDGSGRQSGDTATCFRGPRGLQGGPPARSHAPPRLPESAGHWSWSILERLCILTTERGPVAGFRGSPHLRFNRLAFPTPKLRSGFKRL